MQFLSPWTALLAAAVALPLLLLLYFLKLRRQTLRIPSTLLWRQSYEDLQVNAPFQRLRWSLLLLLQLLMLIALLAALAEPLWRGGHGSASRMVLLIDRSASMNAPIETDAGDSNAKSNPISRLEAAKRAAIESTDALGERGGPSQVMLIAFGSHAQVVSTFESNRGVLRDAVNAITSTDEESNLEAALELASAFAASRDEAAESDAPPQVVLLSDGNVSRRGEGERTKYTLRGGEFRFEQVAHAPREAGAAPNAIDNLGIVALGARRDYDDPARVILFARLLNTGVAALDPIITVSVDGKPAATLRANIPAATGGNGGAAGETSISHALDLANGAVVTLQHNHRDQLAADDVAAIVVPPPSKPRIALVFPANDKPDPFLNELLLAMEPRSVQTISDAAWAQIDPSQIDSGSRFDLIVFDRVSNQRLPGLPSITFGGTPAGLQSHKAREPERGQPILSWDRQHPIMRNLSLDSIVFSGFGGLDLPESTATPLAWGADGPIIALMRTRGARHIVVGFTLPKSNWRLHVSSAMFVQNAMEFLTLATNSSGQTVANGGASGGSGIVFRPGDAITVRAAPEVQAITLEGNGASVSIPLAVERNRSVDGAGEAASSTVRQVTLPTLSRAGLYVAKGALPPNDFVAVSVLSDVESDILPRDAITVNSQTSEAKSAKKDQPLPLWPWLLGAALVLAVIEWLTYCRRVA